MACISAPPLLSNPCGSVKPARLSWASSFPKLGISFNCITAPPSSLHTHNKACFHYFTFTFYFLSYFKFTFLVFLFSCLILIFIMRKMLGIVHKHWFSEVVIACIWTESSVVGNPNDCFKCDEKAVGFFVTLINSDWPNSILCIIKKDIFAWFLIEWLCAL